MSEQLTTKADIPSGYTEVISLPEPLRAGPETLPWLKAETDLQIAECTLQDGTKFYLGSAIATHPSLVNSAEGMTDKQRRNTDNMLYSRLPELVTQGYSPLVETLPEPVTKFPILVMRNKGGQRVYCGRTTYQAPEDDVARPLIIRLGACDKNRQGDTLNVLSASKSKKKIN